MRYYLLRDEKSISEIADKAYKKLSSDEREKLEQAILKENKNLKSFSKVKKGTLIKLPETTDIKQANKRSVFSPIDEMVGRFMENADILHKEVATKLEVREKDIAKAETQLKDMSRIIRKDKDADEKAKVVKKNLAEEKKMLVARKKTLEANLKSVAQVISKVGVR